MALTKVPSNLDATIATTQSASDNSTNVATTAYVTTAVSNLVDGAPAALNTLNEIAAALNDDAALNTTLTNSIATKLPLAGGTMTGVLTINTNAARDMLELKRNSSNGDSGVQFSNSSGDLTVMHAGALGDFTIDTAGDIVLDADGEQIRFKDGGTEIGHIDMGSQNLTIRSKVDNKDIEFHGTDDTANIVALKLDMSDAGYAYFNRGIDIAAADAKRLRFTDADGTFRGGIQAVQTGGQMIATTAQHDIAIRSQSNMLFSTGGNTEKMRIANSGNVGIGEPSPARTLSVRKDTTITAGFNDISQFLDTTIGVGGSVSLNVGRANSSKNLGKMAFKYAGSGSNDNALNFGFYDADNLMTLTANGNVGIGETNPAATLHVEHSSSTAYNGAAEILESAIISNKNGTDDSGVNNLSLIHI